MKLLAPLLSLLFLSGCFDAEITLDFVDETNVAAISKTSMARALYDMSAATGGEQCADGEAEVTADAFICVQSATMPIDEVIANGNPFEAVGDMDPSEGLQIARIDDNTVKVTFELGDLANEDDRPAELQGMEGMAAAAFAGHSIVFRVKGYKILETTGTLSEDGKQADMVIPLVTLLDTGSLPASPFEATVQLAESCAFLGFFCD